MTRVFTSLAFSPAVKAAQARYGVREHGARLEQKEPANDRLTPELRRFVAETDSFFIATASREGWPHVQHRGGPAGFVKVLDDRTLAFADYAGNKQLITVGNLGENDRVMIFIIDYPRGRRLKIWGRARVSDDDGTLLERVSDRGYRAKVERVIEIEVLAFDLNCRQHFPKLVRLRS